MKRKQKDASKIKPLLWFSLVILVLSISFTVITLFEIRSYSRPFETIVIEAEATVEEGRVGFDVTSDGLKFGKIPPGAYAEKNTLITNSKPHAAYARISCEGSICEMLRPSIEEIILMPGESIPVKFTSHAEKNQAPGVYTGKAIIEFYKIMDER